MISKSGRSKLTTDLRLLAEEKVPQKIALPPVDLETLSPEAIRQAFHELHVHQIELAMQNEELRRAQLEMDAVRERYFDLYDLAPVGYFTLDEKGLILEVNLTAASLLGVARSVLARQPISKFIFKQDQDIYYLHRKRLFESAAPQVCELRMVKKDKTVFWVHMAETASRNAGGEPLFRLVVSDISLKIAQQQLRNLSRYTDKMREEERKRIARELHDELGQLLTALKFDLLLLKNDFVENDKLAVRINEISKFVSNTIIKSVQDISSKLRPAVLDKIGLKAAIEWLIDELKQRNNITSEFNANFDELDIGPDFSTVVFRIVQEALTNVVRHARASSITIVLKENDNYLHLLIKDNGQGINKADMAKLNSFGLLGMRERAISLNGELQVEGYPGKGTTITFCAPLQKDASI